MPASEFWSISTLAAIVCIAVPAAGQSIDQMVDIHPLPRSVVEEYLVAASLPPASAQAVTQAYERYRRQADALQAEACIAVENAGFGELQMLTRALTHGRTFNPISGEGGLDRDPELKRRRRDVFDRAAIATIPALNRYRKVLRGLIESMEGVAIECAVTSPRPRWIVLSSLESAPSRNQLDPKLVDMSELVRNSLSDGALRAFSAELSLGEAQRFAEESLLILTDWFSSTEAVLMRRYLAPISESIVFPSPEFVNMDERFAKSGAAWRERYRINAGVVSGIAALMRGKGADDRANQWENEYRSAVCAPIFVEFWPHKLGAWTRQQPEASVEEIEWAEALEARYRAEVAPLRDGAYRGAVAAAEASGFAIFAPTGSRKHERCHEALLRLHLFGRETMLKFAAGISPELQARLRKTWLALGRDIAGPLPDPSRLGPHSNEVLLDWPSMPADWGW